MYSFTPFESARIAAMPMMPIEPANAVMAVRPFFVMRLLAESASAVRKPMDERWRGCSEPFSAARRPSSSPASMGRESPTTRPSLTRTMRVA